MSINSLHRELLSEFLSHSKGLTISAKNVSYEGNNHPSYGLSTPLMRKLAKTWVKNHSSLDPQTTMTFIDKLYAGESSTEKYFAGMLLTYLPRLRAQADPGRLNKWLNHLVGWCEVDSLCQPVFTSKDMSANWLNWKDLLLELAKSSNVNKRRASLVLLTKPVREIGDTRFSDLAFQLISTLKSEKDILITKAVSWLLRHLIKWHRAQIEEYLAENECTLPRIAVREVKNKLKTGRK